jgi:nicotinate-nucleotide pyrophosphorylase (carboxylating)
MFSVSSERLLDLYYEFFHSAHPFILPQHFLVQRFQSNSQSLEALLDVMQYIGAIYTPWTTSNLYKEKAETALFSNTLGKTSFLV